jgi:hypothetical protein
MFDNREVKNREYVELQMRQIITNGLPNRDAPDIRPDTGYPAGRILNWSAGYPVRPDTGYPANVMLV